jgi:zinc protease
MTSSVKLRFAGVLALAAFSSIALTHLVAVEPVVDFPQDESDVPPDPAAHFGILHNGIRYVVIANHEPRDRASLRFLVGAGSLNEKDDQQGLAHFLEHMAFKGSTNYPAGTLIERLQRMGMSFGADTNASTGYERTLYLLEMPDTKPATLVEGLSIFADYAGGLTLGKDLIDSERGVILSEKRDRDSVDFRTYVAEMNFLLPDSLISKRVPIGQIDIIKEAKRDRFADFYDTWYRPKKITVIAVGDFDPAAVEVQIKEEFSGLKARAPGRPDPGLGTVVAPLGLRTDFHPEPEAPAVQIDIETVMPYRRESDTAAVRMTHLKRDLAFGMLNRRFAILSRKESAPFTEASASAGEEYFFLRAAEVQLVSKPENWQKALSAGEQELRRALTYGFQPAELKEIVANFRNELEQAAKGAATRRSNKLANKIADTVVRKKVFTSPAQDLAFYGAALDKITVDDCQEALRQSWAPRGRDIFVSGNLTLENPDRAITAAFETSRAVAVWPLAQITTDKFPYGDFGPTGQLASEKQIEDLGITEIRFANGVRLNLKKTDFEAHKIHVSVRVGSGKLTEPAKSEPGISQLADATFSAGGLGKLGIDDLQRVLAGKTVGFEFKVADDAFDFGGSTDGPDLPLELQLIAAYLTDAGYRTEALWTARKKIPQTYRTLDHTPEGVIETKISRLLASGDPRFGMPAEADVMARNLGELKAWLTPQFANGSIEIALAGDFDPKIAIDAVARTFGALPMRGAKPEYTEERRVVFPRDPLVSNLTVRTEIPKGLVFEVWPTTDGRDVNVARRLGLLGAIFSDRLRLKIRNEMSGAYSPEAVSSTGTVYAGYGSMDVYVSVDPAMADKVAQTVLSIADDLWKHGVTADELERAKEPVLTSIKESARTNDYWLEAVLSRAQEEPQRLDWARTRSEDFAKITKADIDALAAKYLDPARAFRFEVVPQTAVP